MIRTQIQLSEVDYEDLRKTAAKLRRSMADCIREAIRQFLTQSSLPPDDLEEIAGRFRPLPMKDLKPHDQWLAEAIHRSKSPRKHR